MRILTRYILFEFLKVFLVTLLVLTTLIVFFGLFIEARKLGLGLAQVGRLLPFVLLDSLRYAIPATALFAACSVYGKLSSSNEVVAAKSMGIHPLKLLWPVMIASFLLSLLSLWMNDKAVSWGRAGIKRVVLESVEEVAYGMLRTQRSYENKRFSIMVKDVQDKILIEPELFYDPGNNQPKMMIRAQSGQLIAKPEENALLLRVTNYSIDMGKGVSLTDPNTMEQLIPLPIIDDSYANRRPADLPLAVIPTEVTMQKQRITDADYQDAVLSSFQLLTGEFDSALDPGWKQRDQYRKNVNSRLSRLNTEPHRRWASSFCCFCFAFVGAPLAIRLRNADFLTSFFLCFLPILLVYYPLLAFFLDGAKGGEMPPVTIWVGNLILIIAGYWMLKKVIRY